MKKITPFVVAALLGPAMLFAQTRNTQKGCYQAMDHSRKAAKPTAVTANSESSWNLLLEGVIKKARLECKDGPKFGECLGEFVDNLSACDGVGDKKLQTYIEEMRRSALAHATPKSKADAPARPLEVSTEADGATK
jgi:hypothetical protein